VCLDVLTCLLQHPRHVTLERVRLLPQRTMPPGPEHGELLVRRVEHPVPLASDLRPLRSLVPPLSETVTANPSHAGLDRAHASGTGPGAPSVIGTALPAVYAGRASTAR
jgi:hypothetical protein